jgi:hypothetical protein
MAIPKYRSFDAVRKEVGVKQATGLTQKPVEFVIPSLQFLRKSNNS